MTQIKGVVWLVVDNRGMRTLRHFTLLTRLVLAWFVLSLGVAVASPIVKPQDVLLVCTGSGAMKVLVKADDGSTSEVAGATLDCPLCASVSAPPPVACLTKLEDSLQIPDWPGRRADLHPGP